MDVDATEVLVNIRAATTEDLLDRITAYRAGMEPEALDLIEMELHRRGVTPEEIAVHSRQYEHCLRASDGTVLMCSWCRKPAIDSGWAWHWLWGWAPTFPRRYRYCSDHAPASTDS